MLDISEVARQSGFPASTLRYYEEKGLIASSGRRGLKRLYEQDVLQRLSLISLGQVAGFSLDEISQMIVPDGGVEIDRETLCTRADALGKRIKELTALRNGLRHAAQCRAPSYLECQTFQRLMRAAAAHQKTSRQRAGSPKFAK